MARQRDKKAKRETNMLDAMSWITEREEQAAKLAITLPRGTNRFAPKDSGEWEVDVIPWKCGKNHPLVREGKIKPGAMVAEMRYWCHKGVGPNNDTVICNAKMFGKPCAVCDYRASLSQDSDQDEATQKEIKDLSQKERQLLNLYVHEESKKGVQAFDVSTFMFTDYLQTKIQKSRNKPEEFAVRRKFADPEEGCTLVLGGTKKDIGRFTAMEYSDIQFRPRKKPIPDAILAKAVAFEEGLKPADYKRVKELLTAPPGDEEEDDQEEDEDQEEEEEDEDVDDSDDDGDEDEDQEDGNQEDDDGDEEEEDDEEEIEVGSKVSMTHKGKTKIGKVTKINSKTGMALVKLAGGGAPVGVHIDKLTPAGPVKGSQDEDEDDIPPFEEDEEEDEPKPKKGQRQHGGRKKKREEPEDDLEEDEDHDEFEDGEDDEPSPKKRGKKKSKADDDDDF